MRNKSKGWFKPYILNPHNINKIVQAGESAVYVMGNMFGKKVEVKKMGMSTSVKDELLKNLGKYNVFMYKPVRSAVGRNSFVQRPLQFTYHS